MFWRFNKKRFLLDRDDRERVTAAIRTVEAKTTGEVRVFVESRCSYMDALDRARELFFRLKMMHTERRNAVIIYLALDDHQFAIYGDENAYVQLGGAQFWQRAADMLLQKLKEGKVAEGLVCCIEAVGQELATHFPFDPAVHKNELPDEIVFGK